jgi:hypothetical protein
MSANSEYWAAKSTQAYQLAEEVATQDPKDPDGTAINTASSYFRIAGHKLKEVKEAIEKRDRAAKELEGKAGA